MEREAWGLSTHPSQSQCVSASDDGSVRFWDLKEHKQAAIVSLPGRKARAVGYSHDGAAVAVGFMDGEMRRGGFLASQLHTGYIHVMFVSTVQVWREGGRECEEK